MGTNYYLHVKCCKCCKPVGDESMHIGKSSGGHPFTFHIYPEAGIKTFKDWIPLLFAADNVIRDEYGNGIGVEEFLMLVVSKSEKENAGLWRFLDFDFS